MLMAFIKAPTPGATQALPSVRGAASDDDEAEDDTSRRVRITAMLRMTILQKLAEAACEK